MKDYYKLQPYIERLNKYTMGKIIKKIETWEDIDGPIITDTIERGPAISIKDAVKRRMIRISKEEMQKLFSESELEELGDLGYDNTETED